MRSIRLAAVVSLAVLALVSCNRDPNVAKQRYLESGNKYYAKGLYKQARIKYMNALQKDMLFGPAYYGKGMAELKLGAPVPPSWHSVGPSNGFLKISPNIGMR